MHPERVGAVQEREHVRRDGPADPLVRLAPRDRADEPLARRADDDRPAEVAQLAEAAQELEVVLERLAEADARVDPDALLGDAGRDGALDPLGRETP